MHHHRHPVTDITVALEGLDRLLDKTAIFSALSSLLKQTKSLSDGKIVHAYIRKYRYDRTTYLGNWLVQMYGDCGSVADARAAFHNLRNANLYSWTILMKAYIKNGCGREGLDCFQQMQLKGLKPDHVAFICALDACAIVGAFEEAKQIHSDIVDRCFEGQVTVGTALVNMYGKCGSLQDAKAVFGRMPHRNVVTWTAMMTAYVQNGQGMEALNLFDQMQIDGIYPNQITFLCAIDACASLAALETGRMIHNAVVDRGHSEQVVIGNALVNMYGKCGSVQDAKDVFDRMPARNVVSWSAMIAASAQNGHAREALDLFDQMLREGLKPNHVTFLSILTACRHMGHVDAGWHYFDSMSQDHGIPRTVEHYVCLIDLLGRAGQLDDAEELINSMPFSNDPRGWLCLLGACKFHGDMERGVRAANKKGDREANHVLSPQH
ncbi:hypothetical protein O6H91_18G038200 [Diphasiastrum complanatum]|uniref:Uncharacterized protein n=1 Tax=Diphasiastrum complanatum TaxID=34168 RepID=A0ACC2B0Z3_DIPCM|nr:hypothetical protein O6H91_18G038200 [Diphasiastrum complanatum]